MRPLVQPQERDLSTYVREGSTIGVGLIVPVNKGKRETVLKFSNATQLLQDLTLNGRIEVGDNTSLFSALRLAQKTGNLFIVIPKAKGVKYAGVLLNSTKNHEALTSDIDDPEEHSHEASVLVSASSQGKWGNDLVIRTINYKTTQKVSNSTQFTFGDSKKSYSFTLTKVRDDDPEITWGKGYPVSVYSDSLPSELDVHTTYFIGVASGQSNYSLFNSMSDAISGNNPIELTSLPNDTLIGPAISYTKIPNTTCIQVFKKSNLNNPLAEYVISLNKSALDDNGNSLYIEEVLRGTPFIQAHVNTSVSNNYQLYETFEFKELTRGNDGSAVTTGDMIRATRLFDNAKEVKITLIGDGGYSVPAFHNRLRELCERRRDCIPILSAPLSVQKNPSTSAMDIVNWRRYKQNIDSSWATLYAPHVKIYDEFNDRELFIAPDVFVIEQILDTAANYELWYPVAGNRRGLIKAIDTKVHFTDSDQDLLYDNGINPIIFESGKGIRIWGQKTLQSRPSMLDRLNVRLLLITIGPAITEMLSDFLFEFNDPPTRASAKIKVESYMDSIQARRGVTKFTVVCDETNNTPHDIDNHIMRLWLIICPNSSVEQIVFPIAVTSNSAKLENIFKQI